jgi:hypothetical protein
MKPVTENVILDLLPAYLAGDASSDSKALVDEYARHTPSIAALIKAGELQLEPSGSKLAIENEGDMQTMLKIRKKVRHQMIYVAIATIVILLLPLLAMNFTDEVNWGIGDFIVMGSMLMFAGFGYLMISNLSTNSAYKVASAIAIAIGFFILWSNLAVGIIGSQSHPANLLFLSVYAIAALGALRSKFKPLGMMKTMLACAAALALIPLCAMVFWNVDELNIENSIALSLFMAVILSFSARMYRKAA